VGASFALVNLEHVERQLRERLDALGPAPRAELLHVLMLPDFERADRIGEFWGYPESRTFAELLIDPDSALSDEPVHLVATHTCDRGRLLDPEQEWLGHRPAPPSRMSCRSSRQ